MSISTSAVAPAHIIIQGLGYVDNHIIYQFWPKDISIPQKHLSPSVTLKMGVKFTKTSSSLWLVIITYILVFMIKYLPLVHNIP